MSFTGHVHRCPLCGEPYKVYTWRAGDQSACPACIRKAEENMKK